MESPNGIRTASEHLDVRASYLAHEFMRAFDEFIQD